MVNICFYPQKQADGTIAGRSSDFSLSTSLPIRFCKDYRRTVAMVGRKQRFGDVTKPQELQQWGLFRIRTGFPFQLNWGLASPQRSTSNAR